MEQSKSTPVDWVGKESLGFMINAALSEENTRQITAWLEGLGRAVPSGIYPMQAKGLHITVLDWVAPLLDYDGRDKRQLYDGLRPSYEAAWRAMTRSMIPFDIQFNEVRVTPGTIILIGQDGGQFLSLRAQFMDRVTLPAGGKQPPTIVHSSLARFIEPAIDLASAEAYVAQHPLALTQRVSEFRLVETRREPMQDFTVLHRFPLEGAK